LAKLLSNEVATLSSVESENYSVLSLIADHNLANVKYYMGE